MRGSRASPACCERRCDARLDSGCWLQEFLRIGYYVNNDYSSQEMQENPPAQPRLDLLERSILAGQAHSAVLIMHMCAGRGGEHPGSACCSLAWSIKRSQQAQHAADQDMPYWGEDMGRAPAQSCPPRHETC